MENNPRSHFLHAFINPKSIAIIGANEKIPENMGAFHLLTLLDNGYQGEIYPIHPKLETVFGLHAYKTIMDVPGSIDLAQIIIAKRHVPQILDQLGKKGCRHVILVTAGFREQHHMDDRNAILQIANHYGIRIIGPNCIGILNTHTHYSEDLTSTCILNTTVVSYNEDPGNVSIISQSGTYASHIFMTLHERNLHLAKVFSVGNEADIDLCDCLEYLEQDPKTEVILIYIEEIKRGRQFIEIVRRILPRKPILVLYVGGTSGGAKAVNSHTGAMAGDDRVFEGMIDQTGLIRVYSVEELMDTASVFAKLLPSGVIATQNRLAIITNSGGPGASMADRASRLGFELPPLSADLKHQLQKYMAATSQLDNPLDFTFALNPVHFYEKVPKKIAQSGEYDAICVYGALGTKFFRFRGKGNEELAKEKNLKKLQAWTAMNTTSIDRAEKMVLKNHIPVLHVNFLGTGEPLFIHLNNHRLPSFRFPHQPLVALKNYIKYCKRFRAQE